MSDFDPRYHRSPKAPPGFQVDDFKPEVFPRAGKDVTPIPDPNENFDLTAPPKPPAPDPFEEFKVEAKPLSSLMADLPSLETLFKPFDLTSENPMGPEPYRDMFSPDQASQYVYEDLDTRDPEVIRTLRQAEEKRDEIITQAKEAAARIIEGAKTEAQGLAAEAKAQEGLVLEQAEKAAQATGQAAQEHLTVAEQNLAEAKADRETAAQMRAEAEAQLAAAAERIAGLDQEHQSLVDQYEQQRQELESQAAAKLVELEASQAQVLAEAKVQGHQEGLTQGLAEGQATGRQEALADFQSQTAGLIKIMEQLENIYQNLWETNSPMMIELAITAVEQILNKELAGAEDLAAHAFQACIDFLSQAHRVTISARPQDIAQLEKTKAEQRARLGALVKVTFQPDETLGPGDLIVESDAGRLDATIKYRAGQVMGALKEAFAGAYGSSAPSNAPLPPPTEAPQPQPEPEPTEPEGNEPDGHQQTP